MSQAVSRRRSAPIHAAAGAVAILTIAVFWLSTLTSELFAPRAVVVAVKSAIPWGFLVLVPALVLTGATGLAAVKGRGGRVIEAKQKRMPLIAANGILVLIPSAVFLAFKAGAGQFDLAFYAIQAVELIAGATNLVLLGLNMRDGFKLSGRLRRRKSNL